MSRLGWDPERYLAYADERARPFVDLINRIDAVGPRRVVDLGCGPGQLTRILVQRWPGAEVHGVDSSPEMIARANDEGVEAVRYEVADLRQWRSVEPVDVLLSNAALQWVPGHLDLLPALVDQVAPGGWFAFQVPGNFEEPSHVLLRELAAQSRFSGHLGDISGPQSHAPQTYLESLSALGCQVDAWETTYLHVLSGEDPVFRWISGTGARPTLQALPDGLRSEFEEQYQRLLRQAYPARPHGTLLPFRRIFAVAQTPA